MRLLIVFAVGIFLSIEGSQWLAPDGQQKYEPPETVDDEEEKSPIDPIPNLGEACEAGCSVGNHPIAPLTEAEYLELLGEFSASSGERRTEALETLLFHGRQVSDFSARLGTGPLGGKDAEFILRELSRTHARLWLRLVDDAGVVRARVDGARFPVGQKEHVHVSSTHDLQPPEISGTIHRTGLHHLWTRI